MIQGEILYAFDVTALRIKVFLDLIDLDLKKKTRKETMPEPPQENFGDRSKKLIEAFRALDSTKSGRVPAPLISKLLALHAPDFTAEEKQEFFTEADEKGFVYYEPFVQNVIFGKIKL